MMRASLEHSLRVGVCVALALWFHGSPAWADAFDAALRRAVAQKERALDHNTPDQWDAALRSFIAADRLRETKECKFELGYAAEQMKQHDIAVSAYEGALRLGLSGSAASHAEAFVAAQAATLGRLDVRGTDGAEVWIGGYLRGVLPLGVPIGVFAGRGVVQLVTSEGTTRIDYSVAAGQSVAVEQGVAVEPPAPEPKPEPKAEPVPAATSSTAIAPSSSEPESASVAAPPTAPARDERSGSLAPLGWGLAIGGAVVTGVGVTFAALAPSMIEQGRADLQRYCATLQGTDACQTANSGQLASAQGAVDSIATWKSAETAGWVGVGVGAAALTGGVVLLVLSRRSGDAPEASLSPSIGTNSWGVCLRGRF